MDKFWNYIKNKLNQKSAFKEKLKSKLKEYSFAIKPFFIISIIFLISISKIIISDFNYVDDLGRVATGVRGWDNFSRYASSFLSVIIHTSAYLTDISPLPQILAICIMAISAIIILYVYTMEKRFSFWNIVAIIPLGLSPFFLSCLSFKYDAPYMALSVFVSVFPLLFRNAKTLKYSIITILNILLMCLTYQASSGIFLMFVTLLCLQDWNKGKNINEILKFLAISVVSYFLGLIIFKVFIMKPANTYVSNSIFPITELIPGTLKNLYKYFSIVLPGLGKIKIILIALMCVSFVYILVRDSKKKKIISLIVCIITMTIMILLSFGMYPLLMKTSFEPRSMYGFGVFITLIGVAISNSPKDNLIKILILILSWMFIVFSFTYGNALKAQDEYTDFRVNLVIQDLNGLEICKTEQLKEVQISGTIGYAPVIKNMKLDYNILKRLIPVQFKEKSTFGKFYFYNFFGLKNIKENKKADLTKMNLPILKDTMYHTISGNDKYILIKLK